MKIFNNQINLSEFFEKLRLGTQSLLLLDYDGTLAPLTPDRNHAYPYPGIKERIIALLSLTETTRVVIVSGRSLVDLESLLGISNLELWGSHGLERKLPSGVRTQVQIDFNTEVLKSELKNYHHDLSYLEVKPFGLALHTRGMDQNKKINVMENVSNAWEKICEKHAFEIFQFDEGIELRPKGRSKGDVIQSIANEISSATTIAYLGDDLTDEQAFEVIGERGLKVLVRKEIRPTLADILITPPDELLSFLDEWIFSNEVSHARKL